MTNLTDGGGTRPIGKVTAIRPNCADPKFECAWGIDHGEWWLKFINAGCSTHKNVPNGRTHSIPAVAQMPAKDRRQTAKKRHKPSPGGYQQRAI